MGTIGLQNMLSSSDIEPIPLFNNEVCKTQTLGATSRLELTLCKRATMVMHPVSP